MSVKENCRRKGSIVNKGNHREEKTTDKAKEKDADEIMKMMMMVMVDEEDSRRKGSIGRKGDHGEGGN